METEPTPPASLPASAHHTGKKQKQEKKAVLDEWLVPGTSTFDPKDVGSNPGRARMQSS